MDAEFHGPYWQDGIQPDGNRPDCIGVPVNPSQVYGAQCNNKVLKGELEKKNISPISLNARQAFMSIKQDLGKPHVVIPYHCVFKAPDAINIFTDGSWVNPLEFQFALGGAGVW